MEPRDVPSLMAINIAPYSAKMITKAQPYDENGLARHTNSDIRQQPLKMGPSALVDDFRNREYDGIVLKRGLPPGNGHEFKERLWQGVSHNEIRIQHDKRRAGNNEGLTMLDRHDKMEDELAEVRRDMKAVQEKLAATEEKLEVTEAKVSSLSASRISLRRGVLEERRIANNKRSPRDREQITMRERNEVAHGGDILGDIAAIQDAQTRKSPYVFEYKRDFYWAYGIQFDEALDKHQLFPPEVTRAFDILASVRELYGWQRLESRKTIEHLATKITKAAVDVDINQLPARFEDEGDLVEVYTRLVGLL